MKSFSLGEKVPEGRMRVAVRSESDIYAGGLLTLIRRRVRRHLLPVGEGLGDRRFECDDSIAWYDRNMGSSILAVTAVQPRRRFRFAIPVVIAVSFLCVTACPSISFAAYAAAESSFDLDERYAAETARFQTELDLLAKWCREQKLDAEAKRVAGWLPKRSADKSYYFLLDTSAEVAAEADDMSEFAMRFRALREEHAKPLFALAKAAAKDQQYSTAVQLVYETLREQPLHPEALKLLGFQVVNGRRLSAYELAKQRANQVWHPKFGWILAADVKRYEAGERNLDGRWISAAEDARLHATMDRPWRIGTENFMIRTNHSLEEGVRLAERLEKMAQVWRQLFARYHTPEAEWKRLFAGGAPRALLKKPFQVVYYRTREEYVAALVKDEPMVGMTSGLYMNKNDTSYFYADPEKNQDHLLFHEVTHQLFSLSKHTGDSGKRGNFWILEGIACLMESLVLHDDFAELGGSDNPRMRAARFRLLDTKFYVPLVDLTALGRVPFQADMNLAMLYSQASGLASFLMYGEHAKYREATVDYLDAIYTGRDSPLTLTQKIGVGYAELDAAYRRYIESLPAPAN